MEAGIWLIFRDQELLDKKKLTFIYILEKKYTVRVEPQRFHCNV